MWKKKRVKNSMRYAFLDEEAKKEIRRATLKAIAIPGYIVSFASREMPVARGWGTGGLQVTLSIINEEDTLKVIDQGCDGSVNAVNIRNFIKSVTNVETTTSTKEATIIQTRHRIPEIELDEKQTLVFQVPMPDILETVEPNTAKAKIMHANADYSKLWVLLYEDTSQFGEVFDKDGKYILTQEAQTASMAKPNERGTFEREIIKLDEKLNISYLVYNGNLFRMFPQQNGNDNNRWYNPLEAMNTFTGDNQIAIESLIRGFINSVISENWELSNKFIDMIIQYQTKVGSDIMPPQSQIDNEIMFNKLSIFPKLTVAYMILGLIMLIVAFIVVFNPKIKPKKTTFVFFIILALLFALHTFGMGFRWIISGHAPWSDTYESLLYISWSAVFAAVIFFRKSLLALSAGVIVAGIFMFTAHLTSIDPQITNLVPVLKSYWLTIHVSVLTASYGFFGLGAILGFMSLIMFIFRKGRPHLDENIKYITAINEIALIIGLSAITIGNFLGGVWANESWGRYWGWDPKETWAYVSIVVYALVVHLRFVKVFNNQFTFSVASLLAFATILMTYFGVNFYLSGMHSYATGDPVPIPMWVYYVTATVFVTIALAYKNRDLTAK